MRLNELDRAILAHFSPGFGGTEIPQWLYPWLENGLGGLTLFSSNCPSLEIAAKLIEEIKAIAPDIIISIDEEGGDVTRLFVPEGSPFATPALLGRCNNQELTQQSYFELGKILRAVGIDLNLAPVADVSVQTENPIVGVRSFGADYELVSKHVVSAIRGLRKAGVASCIKHFPGHGGVIEDSHHDLPKLDGSLNELELTHLKPFLAAISADVEAIMTGHIVVPEIDEKLPASCSFKATTEFLKIGLGFEGLVVTDALDMGALGGPKKIHQSALKALKAGADLLCFSGLFDQSHFVESALKHISATIGGDEIFAAQLLTNAERLRNWEPPRPTGSSNQNSISASQFLSGVHIQGDVRLNGEQIQLIELSADPTIAAGYVGWGLRRALTMAGKKVKLESSDANLAVGENKQIVVSFRDAFRDSELLTTLRKIQEAQPEAIFVDMGWPTNSFSPKNLIRTYGSSALASNLAVQIMTNH